MIIREAYIAWPHKKALHKLKKKNIYAHSYKSSQVKITLSYKIQNVSID